MSGYSGKALIQKLGIREDVRVLVLHAPTKYKKLVGSLPAGTQYVKKGPAEFIHFFTKEKEELERVFPLLVKNLVDATGSMIWISWPKGTAKVKTDLNEIIVREIGLKNHVVDIKVAAVDETWSGLKFTRRKT